MDHTMMLVETTFETSLPKRSKVDTEQTLDVFENDIEYNDEETFNEIIFEEVISQEGDENRMDESTSLDQEIIETIQVSAIDDIKSYSDASKVIRNIPPSAHVEDVFICDICGNTYDKRSKLSSHLKNHSDLKPHQCE